MVDLSCNKDQKSQRNRWPQAPIEGARITRWRYDTNTSCEQMEIIFIRAVEALGVTWLIPRTAKWLTWISCTAWPTAMNEKPCECIVRNILVEKFLTAHSLPLCIDDCVQPASLTSTIRMLVANGWSSTQTVNAEERIAQELQSNPSTSTRAVSRATYIPKLPSHALYTTKYYILIIYSIPRHWNREITTIIWILRGDYYKKLQHTETSQ